MKKIKQTPTPCPDEYDLWVQRNFKNYSEGHLAMLRTAGQLLSGIPADVLDVGCGLGYAYPILVDNNALKSYTGVDPSVKSINFLREKIKSSRAKKEELQNMSVDLFNCEWLEADLDQSIYDVALCFEVIEHVELEKWPEFLSKIYKHVKYGAFLSTPNIKTSDHGICEPEYVCESLRRAGFSYVSFMSWQWTTFFMATV